MIVDRHGRAVSAAQKRPAYSQRRRVLASARQQDFREGYRALGASPLIWLSQDEIIRRAYTAYMLSPLGGAMIEKPTDIIVGSGFDFKSDDEAVMEALTHCWQHPVNNFPWRQERLTAELGVFGEQCFSKNRNPYTGDVLYGYIHPYAIERTIVDPANNEVVIGVKLKSTSEWILTTATPPGYRDNEIYSAEALKLRKKYTTPDGPQECLFFAVNVRSIVTGEGYDHYGPSLRGTSDLLPALDWIFASDDFLNAMLERADVASRILYDVACEGMTQEEIKAYLDKTDIPDPNTINAHDERIKWTLQAPDLRASEHETGFRLIRNFTISGKGGGFPGHWFGDGQDANRATAQEMYFPTIKHLSRRQWRVAEMFRTLLAHHVQAKGLAADAFEMVLPTISEKDQDRLTTVLQKLTSTLTIAQQQHWINDEEARQAFRASLEDLGIELSDASDDPDGWRVTEDYKEDTDGEKKNNDDAQKAEPA